MHPLDIRRQKAASGRLFAFLGLLLAALLANPAAGTGQGGETVRVRFVPDGDTFVTTDGRVVRLAGIDAPETERRDAPAQFFAAQATERLRGLVLDRDVEIFGIGRDRHGRIVAEAVLTDGRSLEEMLVGEGLAFVYPHADGRPDRTRRLLDLQQNAIEGGRGFWPGVLSDEKNKILWEGNAHSLRFGPAEGCGPLAASAPGRRIAFGSLAEAFREGFAPYRECRSPFNLQN